MLNIKWQNLRYAKLGIALSLLLAGSAGIGFAQEATSPARQRFMPGSARFRQLGHDLASRFSRETRAEANKRLGKIGADSHKPEVGETISFYLDKNSSGTARPCPATLKVIGRHCYVYLEKGGNVSADKLARVARIFDEKIYPLTTATFGSEWKPGIDGDPRITLFLVSGMEDSDGFFYPGDEYTSEKYPTSNEREMLYLSISRMKDIDDFMGHLVAHELQHMIHWHNDANETFWVEEGLSEFAATLFGHVPWTSEQFFQYPDRNLIDWEDTREAENYGHVFLFTDFLLHRPGISETTRKKLVGDIVKNKSAGVLGVMGSLRRVAPKILFESVFRDFCAATFISQSFKGPHQFSFSPLVMKGLAGYKTNQVPPRRTFKTLKGNARGKVSMWSAAAYEFAASGKPVSLNINFKGATSKTKFGNNNFMLGLAMVDSQKKSPPQVLWLRTSSNQAGHQVKLPAGNYDKVLLMIVNRGPNRHKEEDGRLAKVDFEFSLSSENSAIQRFESLHNPVPGTR